MAVVVVASTEPLTFIHCQVRGDDTALHEWEHACIDFVRDCCQRLSNCHKIEQEESIIKQRSQRDSISLHRLGDVIVYQSKQCIEMVYWLSLIEIF